MASKLSIHRAQAHVTCALCESEQNVNWFCNDCQETLCDRCKDGHKRGKRTRNDDIVPYREARRDSERPVPEVCKTHPGKSCDLYCRDCKVVMCATCFIMKHKQHDFTNFEGDIDSQRKDIQDQVTTLKSKVGQFQQTLSKRQQSHTLFSENIDVMRKDIKSQISELKAEMDSIGDAALAKLTALEKKESEIYKKECQKMEKNVKEMKQLIETAEGEAVTLFDLSRTLRTTVPLYDVNTASVLPWQPRFVPGTVDVPQLSAMMGHIQTGYERKEIDSSHVHQVSTFKVPTKNRINSICPINDQHAWVTIHSSSQLMLVNKDGNVTESLQLDFVPYFLALTNTSGLLVTYDPRSPLIYNVSDDRRVTTFADVTPHQAVGISVSECNEVVVCTGTPTILVLNSSGNTIKKLTCGSYGYNIVCLSSGHVAVTTGARGYCTEVVYKDMSDKVVQTWTRDLDNGQKVDRMVLCTIGCDKYDRVFVQDYTFNQVYVISRGVRHATRLLDKKHGVKAPTSVCVDTCGDVWIGCHDGTVHVMRLQTTSSLLSTMAGNMTHVP